MKACIVRTRFDRKTGGVLEEEITEQIEIDEEVFYKPLVEIFYNDLNKKIQSQLVTSQSKINS